MVTDNLPAESDVSAAPTLAAAPGLQMRANRIRPHADEYAIGRWPKCLFGWSSRHLNGGDCTMDLHDNMRVRSPATTGQYWSRTVKQQWNWYMAGIFTAWKSQHDFIVVRPHASETAATVIVHPASSSHSSLRRLTDFFLVVAL